MLAATPKQGKAAPTEPVSQLAINANGDAIPLVDGVARPARRASRGATPRPSKLCGTRKGVPPAPLRADALLRERRFKLIVDGVKAAAWSLRCESPSGSRVNAISLRLSGRTSILAADREHGHWHAGLGYGCA
jgi:hypothetical protein